MPKNLRDAGHRVGYLAQAMSWIHPFSEIAANCVSTVDPVLALDDFLTVAFDGDADRIGAVDHLGRVVWGDQLLALYAAEVLAEHPGAPIIADVKSSQMLFDEVTRLGGRPLMWRTGHSLLKGKMAEIKAPLAGEMSGHIFFADRWFGFDDGLYCAIRLASLIGRSGRTLAALRDHLPSMVNTPEIRIQVDETRKFAVVEEVKARMKTLGADVFEIDGVRVRTPDGWWLLRASNTQDALTIRCESNSTDGLERLQNQLHAQLRLSNLLI
ncbi:hypothetical protein CCP2SC5_2760001 [Azospirillaceae bacterium]